MSEEQHARRAATSTSAASRVADDVPVLRHWGVAPYVEGLDSPSRETERVGAGGRKLCGSLEEAIKRSGLRDGGTISFHHHFREGDQVILPVVAELDRLGYRDLTLAASSLGACHAGLIEYIKRGVVSRIYTSSLGGELADAVSHGLMDTPVMVHSDGGRCALMDIGELRVDVAFLGVPACDEFGNADGTTGAARCGSLGFAMVDAARARCVVLVTEDLVSFPHALASIRQDQVDLVVTVNSVGDPKKIAVGAVPTTANPRELLIARYVADVLINSGLFVDGFSMRTGSDASAVATTRYLREEMVARGVRARWALGGIAGDLVEMSHEGLVSTLLDVRSLDAAAVDDLAGNSNHREISANEYANPFSKGAAVDELDMVVLPALEVGLDFGVNVLTGSNGVMSGTSGGHCDAAAGAKLAIVVAPLLRGRVPTVVEQVTTLVTPGSSIDALVTDYGVAVNPGRAELADRLTSARVPVHPIEELYDLSNAIAGKPGSKEFTDKIVGIVRYRDGSVIDTVHEVAR